MVSHVDGTCNWVNPRVCLCAAALDGCFFGTEAADVHVVEGLADVEGYGRVCGMPCGGAEGGTGVAGGRGR